MDCQGEPSLMDMPPVPGLGAAHQQRLMEAERRWAESHFGARGGDGPASIGIVGAGLMGTAIAAAVVRHGIPVRLVDLDHAALASALPRTLRQLNTSPGAPPRTAPEVAGLLRTSPELAALADCDLVVESVVEKLAVKQHVLARLESVVAPGAIVASNTSTISWAQLATPLQEPGRMCGCHFFLPFGQAPMIEIIRGAQTRDDTLVAAVRFAKAIDHLPLVVTDAPGFVVNRLLVPFLAEAMQLLTEGVAAEAIERAAENFGMLMGPLRLLDEIGLDTALECALTMESSSTGLVIRSPLLVAMVKARQLGRKTQAGFFLYDEQDERPRIPNPQLAPLLARWRGPSRSHTAESILLRLLFPMLFEATRMLERGSVRDAAQIDLAIVCGFGFPASRGGLLCWADRVGAARIVRLLETLEYLGPRAQPPPLLLDMARQNRRFFEPLP